MHCSNVEKVLHQRIFQQVWFWAPGVMWVQLSSFLRDPFLPSLLDLKFITLRTAYSSVTWSHKFDICFNTLPLMKKYQNYNPLCSAPFRGWANNNNSFLAGQFVSKLVLIHNILLSESTKPTFNRFVMPEWFLYRMNIVYKLIIWYYLVHDNSC